MFVNTRAVASKLLQDVKRILKVTTTIVNVVFVVFYLYEIYSNFNNLIFLIANCVLLSLLITVFIVDACKNKQNKKQTKQFKRAIRICRYTVKLAMLSVTLYNTLTYGADAIQIILFAISAISLFVNVLVEIAIPFVERYTEYFMASVQMDAGAVFKIVGALGNKHALLDLVPEMLADKIEKGNQTEENMTDAEQKVKEWGDNLKQTLKEQKAARTNDEKSQLKQHLKVIGNHLFRRKKKKSTLAGCLKIR